MTTNQNKIEKIKKAQLLLLFPIGFCFVAMIILGVLQQMDFYAIPGVLITLLGFAEIILAIARSNKNNKQNKQPRSSSFSGGANASYVPPPIKRATDDSFIKEIDDYVAREFSELPLDNALIGLTFATDYLSDIRKTAYEMQMHLGLASFIITISLRKLNDENTKRLEAGHFKRTGLLTAEIEIDSSLSKVVALACLAHEMSHAYQSFKGKSPYPDGTQKEEQFTDLLTYYLGFSDLVKNGYYSGNTKLGYVETGDFTKIEQQYSSRTSSIGSYKKEKNNLKELIDLYASMVEQVLSLCENLLVKYIAPDDKEYIKSINEKYSSAEVKDYIFKINNNIERRAKLNINMDQIGVEMKIEELMEEKKKVERIYNYVFGN